MDSVQSSVNAARYIFGPFTVLRFSLIAMLVVGVLRIVISLYNDLIMPKVSIAPLVPVKSTFVPNNYLNELNLFKSLSPADQHMYMNMSRAAKRAKYPSVLQ